MFKRVMLSAAVLLTITPCIGRQSDMSPISKRYKALKYAEAPESGTWAILNRDGANRTVDPYLSSLGGGESGRGVIVSPEFTIAVDTIAFTICGHDGQGGGRGQNFIALIDTGTGDTLRKTAAPGSDPMKEQSWNVADLRGRRVRIEVQDANPEGAYAWLGVGRINAGAPLTVDFSKGLPDGWKQPPRPADDRGYDTIEGGVPFRPRHAVYTMIPESGAIDIPCGFQAERLFFLGGTVALGRPLQDYGRIEIQYSGDIDRVPLLVGYTLDTEGLLPSRSPAIHLHPSGDPSQFYFVIAPQKKTIERIRIVRNPEYANRPRITAVTCETSASGKNLLPLPDLRPGSKEAEWIRTHTISSAAPPLEEIQTQIREATRPAEK